MSDLKSRASYIKGLADGMSLNTDEPQSRLLSELVQLMCETASAVDAIDDAQMDIEDELEEIQCALDFMNGEDFHDEENVEVRCPSCNDFITVDLDNIDDTVICPSCGQEIEFDYQCDCGECGGEDGGDDE